MGPLPVLEGVESCRHVTEYHPPCRADAVGMPQPGEILDERFLITEVVSRSGMAMIYRARTSTIKRRCRLEGAAHGV